MKIADEIIKKILQLKIPLVDLDSYRATFPPGAKLVVSLDDYSRYQAISYLDNQENISEKQDILRHSLALPATEPLQNETPVKPNTLEDKKIVMAPKFKSALVHQPESIPLDDDLNEQDE